MANEDLKERKKLLQENQDLLNKFLKSQTDLNDEAQTELRITRDINNEIREGLKLVNKEVDLKNSVRKAISSVAKISEQNFSINKLDLKTLESTKDINKKILKLREDQKSLAMNSADISELIRQKTQEAEGLEGKKKEAIDGQIKSLLRVAEAMENAKTQAEIFQKNLKIAKDLADEIGKNQKVGKGFEGVGKVIDKIPGLSGLGDGFKAAAGEAKNIAARMTKTNKLAEAMGKGPKFTSTQIALTSLQKGFKALGGFISKVIFPIALLKGVLDFDKRTGEIAKNFNMTNAEATKLNNQFTGIAMRSGETSINSKGIAESFTAINSELGTAVMPSEELLNNFTKLRKSAGLTNKELFGIAKLTGDSGKEFKKATGEVLAQAKITSLRNGVLLNEKETLKAINKVSAATTLSLQKDPKAIAEAVAEAKSLGMELGKVESIADSLLDFESSISKELEAEMLLGKDINLEKARQFALENNIAGVAREIAKQAGSAAEFGKMNRIQQQALADAVGMSREELAESLFIQEQLKDFTGDEAKAKDELLQARIKEVGLAQAQKELAEGGFKKLEDQKNTQEKLTSAVAKMQDIFVQMAPAITAVADVILLIMEPITMISQLVGAVSGFFTEIGEKIGGLIGPLGVVGKILKGIASIAIIFAAYKAFSSLASIPYVGAILGAVAAAAVVATGFGLLSGISTGNDVFSPGEGGMGTPGPAGFGSRTLMGPEGAIALNNKDTVIAGTNLFPGDSNGGGTTVVQENTEAKKTNQLLETLLKKPTPQPVIQMNDVKLGTAVDMGAFSIQ